MNKLLRDRNLGRLSGLLTRGSLANVLSLPFLLMVLCAHSLHAQTSGPRTFKDYPVYHNIDSLEKAVQATRHDPERHLTNLISLERSRIDYLDIFGSELQQIKNLAIQQNSAIALAMYQYLEALNIWESDLGNATANCLEALRYFDQINDTTGRLNCYFTLLLFSRTAAFKKISNVQQARYYYEKIDSIGQNSKLAIHKLLRIKAILVFDKEVTGALNFEKGNDCVQQALALFDQHPELAYSKGAIFINISSFYTRHQKFEESLRYAISANEEYKTKSSRICIKAMYGLALEYFRKEDPSQAIEALKIVLKAIESQKKNLSNLHISASSTLAELYFKHKKYQEAWLLRDKVDSLNTQRQVNLKKSIFQELQTKYETETRNNENRILIQKNKLAEVRNQQIMVLLVGGTLVVVVIGILSLLALRKKNQLIEFRNQLISIIAHDMRSPLTAFEGISAQVSYLLRKGDYESVQVLSTSMDDSIYQSNLLLQNLLAWAMSNNSSATLSKTTFTVIDQVSEIAKLYNAFASSRNSVIEVDMSAELRISADKNGIALMLRNLVDNSIKHSLSGKVVIRAFQEDHSVVLMVQNVGVRLEEDILLRLQQQLSQGSFDVAQNGGLGLLLVHDVVKKHNGRMEVLSNEDLGTVFKITLPQD